MTRIEKETRNNFPSSYQLEALFLEKDQERVRKEMEDVRCWAEEQK